MSKTPKPVTKTYTYFDLDKMEKVEVEKEIPNFVPKTADEVLALVSEDNTILTKAVNAFLKRASLREIKKSVAALGGSTTVVMALAKPFRAMPPFNAIYERNSDGSIKVDEKGEKVVDRKEQSKQIFGFLKSNPAIVESIKAASLAAAESDEDDDENESEEKD